MALLAWIWGGPSSTEQPHAGAKPPSFSIFPIYGEGRWGDMWRLVAIAAICELQLENVGEIPVLFESGESNLKSSNNLDFGLFCTTL